MPSHPLVSVIVVTWNSKAHLPRCLAALSSQTTQNFEVVLVDNGSTDGSVDNLSREHPSLNLRVECLNRNLGFAAANNLGARLAHGKWLALLNADAFPAPDWLEKLLKATEEQPGYSFFSSRQIQAYNPECLDGTGDAYYVSGMAWRRNIGYPANQFGLFQEEVFSPCAAAALYLRAAFIEVGGFDEDFFSYYEDIDLGFRLRLYGYRCLYVSEAIVHHVGSATVGVMSDFVLYYSHRNIVWTFVQNMPAALFWRYLFAHIALNIIYMLYYTLRGRGKILWKAKFDAMRGLTKALKKRRVIQKARKATSADLLHVMERGWLQPYLLGYNLRRAQAQAKKNTQ